MASGCDSVIYDYEDDCDPHHKVKFIYDHNLKFADAFPAEVREVTLYIIDPSTGTLIREVHDDSPLVSQPGYMMEIQDLPPGRYKLLAWGGEGHKSHFEVAGFNTGHKPLSCHLVAEDTENLADNLHHTSHPLGHLYHGIVEVEDFTDTQGIHVHEVKMIKDTNDFHIVLQHVHGKQVNPDDFTFTIEADNGHLAHDNSVMRGYRKVNYHPWFTARVSAGIEKPNGQITTPGSGTQVQATAALADLRTSRLINDDGQKVVVRTTDGRKVISLPLTDYCTMVKGKHRDMEDQEYLDRQDDYSMVFFLDDNNDWMDSYIYVNSWRVVLQNVDM